MGYIKPCAMFNTLWQTGQEGRKKKERKGFYSVLD